MQTKYRVVSTKGSFNQVYSSTLENIIMYENSSIWTQILANVGPTLVIIPMAATLVSLVRIEEFLTVAGEIQ